MRIIARRALREFWEVHADAEQPLRAWYHDALRADWKSPADVKRMYASASIVGENRLVFNIGGNKYRLITRIRYATQKVFVLKVMTHSEYNEDKWKDECGCFEPPPRPKKKKSAATKRPTRRR